MVGDCAGLGFCRRIWLLIWARLFYVNNDTVKYNAISFCLFQRHGYGKETLDSGTVLSAHWKENRKHGKVSVELKTGDINHGVFEQVCK